MLFVKLFIGFYSDFDDSLCLRWSFSSLSVAAADNACLPPHLCHLLLLLLFSKQVVPAQVALFAETVRVMWHIAMLALSFVMALGSAIASLRYDRRTGYRRGGLTRQADILSIGSQSRNPYFYCFCLMTSFFVCWTLKSLIFLPRIMSSIDPICSRVIRYNTLILMLHGGAHLSTLRNQRLL